MLERVYRATERIVIGHRVVAVPGDVLTEEQAREFGLLERRPRTADAPRPRRASRSDS